MEQAKMESVADLVKWQKAIEEQLTKMNVALDTVAYGLTQICNVLELAGLMKAGEPTTPKKEVSNTIPSTSTEVDVTKVLSLFPADLQARFDRGVLAKSPSDVWILKMVYSRDKNPWMDALKIVKNNGGKWVSAGKDSQFEIPRK